MWFHEDRQFKIQIAHTTSDVRSIKNLSATVSRTIKEHFSYEELVLLLEPFTRKRKMKLTEDGGVKIGAFRFGDGAKDFEEFMENLFEPPQKKFSTSISEENLDKLKRYSYLNGHKIGKTIEMLMSMNKGFFEGLPEIEEIQKFKKDKNL